MKMTVIIDEAGKIVGAARRDVEYQPDVGDGSPVAGPGQTVHVIEAPDELENAEDANEFHNKLRTLLEK